MKERMVDGSAPTYRYWLHLAQLASQSNTNARSNAVWLITNSHLRGAV